ncbi:lipoprotein-releasing system permease protein [Dyadobacter jejuensis]|uniref:Lipoprotein-releasing system permease protein n=1 Tax=Dyadobacter jejuensis TaxID=1082580 RepID=A0A316ANN4_9BACT|nr:FtsX-like permease family protein [Dyadobacter jejuensis]PWJ58919.1 lipoprotein-releasing system permease protein [Dyadobacter jejuensis]
MNYHLIIDVAKALLLARWKQTLVAAIGVTFSIGMFITLLSFMTGLNDLLDGLVLNRTPHIRLYNEIKPNPNQPIYQVKEYADYHHFIRSIKASGDRQSIYNNGAIMQVLQEDKRVSGFSPKITAQVFFNAGAIEITGVVNGIEVIKESQLFHFNDYIVAGEAADLEKVPNSIILGKGLADKLLAELGDVVQVTTAKGEIFPLKVVGFFQSGMLEFDKVQSYASIMTTQKLLGKPGDYITDIQIKLTNMTQAPSIAQEYRQIFGTDAEDIQTANAQFETGSFIRTLISYAVGITLLIVAGFGIYNILNMMIFEKMDSIAILKAIGFSGSDVKSIFLLIALSIGFFGGVLGLMLGFGLSLLIDQVPFTTASLPTITTYPVNYSLAFYAIGTSFSLITTFLAGWFPSRKASQVDPVVIIRGK